MLSAKPIALALLTMTGSMLMPAGHAMAQAGGVALQVQIYPPRADLDQRLMANQFNGLQAAFEAMLKDCEARRRGDAYCTSVLYRLVRLGFQSGDEALMKRYAQRALDAYLAAGLPRDLLLAESHFFAGNVLVKDDPRRAAGYLEEALALGKPALPESAVMVTMATEALAKAIRPETTLAPLGVKLRQDDPGYADELERVYAERHTPQEEARRKKFDLRYEALLLEALALRRKYMPGDPGWQVSLHEDLAYFYAQNQRYAQSASHRLEALDIVEKLLPPTNPAVAYACWSAANAANNAGQTEAAGRLFERALALARQSRAKDDPELALYLQSAAPVAFARKDYARALALEQERRALLRVNGAEPGEIAIGLFSIAINFLERGEVAIAADRLIEIVQMPDFEPEGMHGHYLAYAHEALADIFVNEGRFDLAETHLRRAADAWGRSTNPRGAGRYSAALAAFLVKRGTKVDEARTIYRFRIERALEYSAREVDFTPEAERRLVESNEYFVGLVRSDWLLAQRQAGGPES